MATYRYTVLLEPDPDEGGYTVTVPELPGCITQGESLEESLEHAQEAIEGHIKALQMLGEEVPIEREAPQLAVVTVEVEELVRA
jgi:predicted RNase H-like HicB family nuclease